MTLTRPRSAWILAGLQFGLAVLFHVYLKSSLPPGMSDADFFSLPTWFVTMDVLGFGLALILALCAMWNPEIAAIVLLLAIHTVCPILFFTDLTRNPYFTQITLLNIWVSFLWIVWLVESLEKKVFAFPRTILNLPLLAFTAVATLSWGMSFLQHPARFHPSMLWEGLRNWLFLIVNAVGVFYVAYTVDEKWRGRFLWVTFWVAALAAAYGLMQYYGIEQIWQKALTPFANRPVSTFGNPNFLSSYLLLVIPPLAISVMTAKTPFKSGLSLIFLLVTVAGLVATMTRSTWVGAFMGLALLPAAPPVRSVIKNNLKKFYILGAIVLCSVVFWPQSKLGGYRNPWERLSELREIGTGKRYHPWSQRILIWSCSFMMVKDHPVLGKGFGLMELFYPYYQGRMLFHPVLGEFRTHANNSHNEILEIWSQTGTLGLGIYLWLWIVLIYFAYGLAKSAVSQGPPNPKAQSAANPYPPSIWGWALACSAVGMFVDNFFGNVSLHFCVPAFLFWWQAGLLFGMGKAGTKKADQESAQDYHLFPINNNAKISALALGIVFFLGTATIAFRKEFQEIFYFNGFKIAKGTNMLDVARQQLEEAWKWFPREVNTNYELSNTYARLSQDANRQGIAPKAEEFRKKAIWAYLESLRSNCGYDEIFFNLAATYTISGWNEDDGPDFDVEMPNGRTQRESVRSTGGSISNFTHALLINPMSQEGYNYLGNIYLQNQAKYSSEAFLLFQQGIKFFPRNKDFWVNLAYLNIHDKKFDEALIDLKAAMSIDPFYELTRKNLRAVLAQSGNMTHPMAEVDRILSQVNTWVNSRDWPMMKNRMEYCLKQIPECAPLWLILANVCHEMNLFDQAESHYLKAMELEPNNITAPKNLALTYMKQGKLPQAKTAYLKALDISPNDPDVKKALELLPK